jgi:hypothetical protein
LAEQRAERRHALGEPRRVRHAAADQRFPNGGSWDGAEFVHGLFQRPAQADASGAAAGQRARRGGGAEPGLGGPPCPAVSPVAPDQALLADLQ